MMQRHQIDWRETCIYEAKARDKFIARLYTVGVHRSESVLDSIERNETLIKVFPFDAKLGPHRT